PVRRRASPTPGARSAGLPELAARGVGLVLYVVLVVALLGALVGLALLLGHQAAELVGLLVGEAIEVALAVELVEARLVHRSLLRSGHVGLFPHRWHVNHRISGMARGGAGSMWSARLLPRMPRCC